MNGPVRRPHRRWRWAMVAVLATSLSVLTDVGTANAVDGYHTAGDGVRVRAGATTQSAQIGTIAAAGTAINIACQVAGESVSLPGWGTSSVWDRLNGYNGYISDLFVQETPYAQFDPRIPRCDAPAPSPAPVYVTSATVNIRSAPSFNATYLGSIPAGTPITIQCQNYGTKVNGSFIWDKVNGGFISDYYVNGTPFNAFDSRLPRCGLGYGPVDCSKVLFIGARGSGEPLDGRENLGGPGSPVQETRNRLAARGVSLDVAGVIYPAQSIEILQQGDVVDYFAGVPQGVSALLTALRKRTDGNVCGWQHTTAVLVGYSQGALVVGNAIDQMTTQERATVRGVATYGNPRFTPNVNGADLNTWMPGKLLARGPYADGVNGRSRDYCRADDIVCQLHRFNTTTHLQYVSPGPQVDAGSAFLAAQFGR